MCSKPVSSLLQDISPSNARRSREALNAKNPRYPWYQGSTSLIYFDSFSSGVSQYKQAFSTSYGNLLVRKKPCACPACIDMDWENCALKVNTTPRSNQCFELSWFNPYHSTSDFSTARATLAYWLCWSFHKYFKCLQYHFAGPCQPAYSCSRDEER